MIKLFYLFVLNNEFFGFVFIKSVDKNMMDKYESKEVGYFRIAQ